MINIQTSVSTHLVIRHDLVRAQQLLQLPEAVLALLVPLEPDLLSRQFPERTRHIFVRLAANKSHEHSEKLNRLEETFKF